MTNFMKVNKHNDRKLKQTTVPDQVELLLWEAIKILDKVLDGVPDTRGHYRNGKLHRTVEN